MDRSLVRSSTRNRLDVFAGDAEVAELVVAQQVQLTDGAVVAALKTGLSGWAPLTVQPKLPATPARRMVTVRNESGPQEGVQSRRRYGINVWADSSVDAEKIALDAMSVLRGLPNGKPITATDQFSGPFEIEDETPYIVVGKNLTHFYFTFRLSARATNY